MKLLRHRSWEETAEVRTKEHRMRDQRTNGERLELQAHEVSLQNPFHP